ncbi:MAG: hypothetical protein WA721_12705 [Candidatus Binataceae bacterium]
MLDRDARASELAVCDQTLSEETTMPAALISVMDVKERTRYAKQMDELIKLLRKNNEQVTKLAMLMEKMVKAMGASS